MKKLTLLCLFIAFLGAQQAYAQPTFYISPAEQVVDENDQVCVSVIFKDFTNLIGISFSLHYDPGVLDYNGVTPASIAQLPGLTTANIQNPEPGVITFEWDDGQPCETATNGPTIDDFEQLFEICFIAHGIYGNHTPICFADEPVDQVVSRSSANCQDIGEFTECGFISIGTEPLKMNISSGDGFTGDVVCLDVEVENFDCIISFQNSILWDETVLEYVSATPTNLQEFTASNIGTTQVDQGVLNLSWWTTGTGVDLADGTQIMEICFEIIGECGDNTEVAVGPNPLGAPVEVVDCTSGSTSAGTNIGLLGSAGEVSVNCFDPDAITVTVEDKQICPGQSFTVDVSVQDFESITDLEFTLKWNPDVISLNNSPSNGVSYPDGQPCFLFGTGGTVDINPTQGTIIVDWNTFSFGCDVDDNDRLMRLHFTAIGSSGTNTTVSIINPINVEKFGAMGDNIGINNNNGLIEICELNSPTIIASSATLDAGEEICVQFTVQDFDDILRTQYTLNWEPSVLEYVSPQSFNLPNLGVFNFLDTQTDQGFLGVEWENGTPVTVPDGTVIYEVCFNVIGDPDDCSPIEFAGVPWPIDITTAESSGTNVGLNGVPGEVCVENPLDFFVDISEAFGSPGAEVCLDVTATGFTQLTEMNYSINWNTSIIEYARIEDTGNLPNFSDASYDDSFGLVNDGQLVMNWESDNTLQGTTLPDGTSLFQICFQVVGEDGDCSGVSISDNPAQIDIKTAPTGPANLGMTHDPGEICVNATINLLNPTVVNVACPTVPSGSIDLEVQGGSGDYTYEWVGFNVNPSTQDQTGLFAGTYYVTVTDSNNPALVDNMEITVDLEPNAPIASAGVDTTLNCLSQGLVLDGSGSSVGTDITYFWEPIGPIGSVNPETDSTLQAEIFGPSEYLLTVTDTITGCFDLDTVMVAQAIIAVPEIEEMTDLLTCEMDTLSLDGGSTSFGFEVSWETSNGSIVAGTENDLQPMITEPGMYILTFSNPITSCVRSDTVEIFQDIEEPTAAVASNLSQLGCQDEETTVDGTGSSVGTEFIYEWTPLGAGEICGDETSLISSACSAGEYQLMVTDTDNGCTAVVTMMVEADTAKPTAIAGPNQFLDCLTDMVVLDGSASSQGSQFEYTWTDEMNNPLGSDLTLDITTPGIYTLEVMDTDNDCSAISEVVVEDIRDTVITEAFASNAITCGVDTSLLDWGQSAIGANFFHTWLAPDGGNLGNTDSLIVDAPGTYVLTIFNSENNCTGTFEVEVEDQSVAPEISAGDEVTLGCVDFVELQGDNLGNPNLIYQWQGPGVGCITNGTTLNPQVECPGTYTLVVEDITTECTNSATVEVIDDTQAPSVAIVPLNSSNEFPCNEDELQLSASTDDPAASVMWTSVPAVPISGETTLNPTIAGPAVYTLTVTAANGCSSDSTIAISQATPPVANAGSDTAVDCQVPEITLSAENSTLTGTTILWEALTGNAPTNPNDIEVTVGSGTYQLTVIDDETGCSSTDEVVVDENGELPDVDAGMDAVKECDEEFVLLLGDAEAGLTYTWTNELGEIVGSNLSLQATNEGIYTLTVYNSTTDCENSDQASVSFAISADSAFAQADHDPCAPDAMLVGNLPEGATGEWQSITGASIDNPAEATALASGFMQGENTFVWTLSLGTCVEYSSDTVTVVLNEEVPDAVDDFATIDNSTGAEVQFNIFDNDDFDASISEVNLVPTGVLNGSAQLNEDGTMTFSKDDCFVGTIEFEYEICSTVCPELCDRATISIDAQALDVDNCDEVPNAITPNGDGVNDELVFDIILSNPDFQDNEITIFNRWGDIVFEARPYLNDWRGTNDSGKDLPHGTYYYILKLDIANGDIIRGDVTILK